MYHIKINFFGFELCQRYTSFYQLFYKILLNSRYIVCINNFRLRAEKTMYLIGIKLTPEIFDNFPPRATRSSLDLDNVHVEMKIKEGTSIVVQNIRGLAFDEDFKELFVKLEEVVRLPGGKWNTVGINLSGSLEAGGETHEQKGDVRFYFLFHQNLINILFIHKMI